MSYTFTQNTTFTYTNAKYLASKVASDLRQVNLFYKQPSKEHISDLVEEFGLLLRDGYLKSVDYGFEEDGKVIFALAYHIREDGSLSQDDDSGNVSASHDVSRATWFSYLRKSAKFWALNEAERMKVTAALPFQRGTGPEPEISMWSNWIEEKKYFSNGTSVNRKRLVQWL